MYQGKMGTSEFASELFNKANILWNAVDEAYVLYKKFYDVTYGLTPAEILALPQMTGTNYTEADILKMQNAMNCLGDFYKAMHNESVSQVDRFGYLYPFL